MTEVLTANRIPLENYAEVVGAGEIEELRALAKPLRGRSIEMINSTAVGGGVAEILNRLVPLAEELDLGIRWEVMQGAEEFFDVTKSFHNALHGEPYHRTPKDFEIFLSYKNCSVDPEFVEQVLHRYHIDPQRPILTQISRFDRLKDPVGVIRAYRIVKRYFDCQLVLAGGSASDDPEGALVLQDVLRAADEDPDIKILELPAWAPLEVNALQRASTIVVQKSLREGFGLTVSEALWKKKPVVASAVGGIPTQIIHKHTGLLAHSVEGTAYQIRFLLSHPEIAAKFGENGHEHVKENFLITQKLKRYLALFLLLDRH